MKTNDIADAICRIIGRHVSRSQVSHARGYFGPCNDDVLIKRFVNFYEQTGKYPRKRETKKADSQRKPAYCYFEVQTKRMKREFAVPFDVAWENILAVFKPMTFPGYDEIETINMSFVH